jgi:hypothetical protein
MHAMLKQLDKFARTEGHDADRTGPVETMGEGKEAYWSLHITSQAAGRVADSELLPYVYSLGPPLHAISRRQIGTIKL